VKILPREKKEKSEAEKEGKFYKWTHTPTQRQPEFHSG
jgi:hypothetical protein